MPEQARISDLELVRQAVEMPGQMGPQYNYFRELSYGNQAYLYFQGAREIVGKFIDWKKVGRHVIAGSKAYEIIRPVFRKIGHIALEGAGVEEPEEPEQVLTGFVPTRCIFTLSQTQGPEIPPIQVPRWDMVLAMGRLGIREVEYEGLDGNRQGYSRGLEFAVSPIAAHRLKTILHEWAHIVGGHTMPSQLQLYRTHRGAMEAEAEISAMLCLKEFDMLDDTIGSEMRAYAQYWLDGGQFTEASARKVLKISGAIIRAGRAATEVTVPITVPTPTTEPDI